MAQAQVMHGMSGQEYPEPEEGQSQDLQRDLKNTIDWQWIKVGPYSTRPHFPRLSAKGMQLILFLKTLLSLRMCA